MNMQSAIVIQYQEEDEDDLNSYLITLRRLAPEQIILLQDAGNPDLWRLSTAKEELDAAIAALPPTRDCFNCCLDPDPSNENPF